jgi:hypothetical protein
MANFTVAGFEQAIGALLNPGSQIRAASTGKPPMSSNKNVHACLLEMRKHPFPRALIGGVALLRGHVILVLQFELQVQETKQVFEANDS